METYDTKQQVLLMSYLRVLTDPQFLEAISKGVGSNLTAIYSGSQPMWQAGSKTNLRDVEFRDLTLVFEQRITLRNFAKAILGSQFRNSLKLFRRPGDPKGISVEAAVAEDEGAPAVQGQALREGPYRINSGDYTGTDDLASFATQYDSARQVYYADYKEEAPEGTKFWRVEDTDEERLGARMNDILDKLVAGFTS